LSNLQIKEDLRPWEEQQNHHRPPIYEVRNQTLGGTIYNPSATMPIMRNNISVVGYSLDPRQIRLGSHLVRNVPKH
jgi:hypothetical protein